MSNPYERIRPFCDWHEDHGDVLWWRIPVDEPPYLGSPLDLGRSVTAEVTFGFESAFFSGKMMGGWPFSEEDRPYLWWTPIPRGNIIEDQVPL